jgi:predicted RNA binding protein with dsRBD fold (UPF0201 family)
VNGVHFAVRAEVHPTEDESKVKHAIMTLFPSVELRCIPDSEGRLTLIGEAGGLEGLTEFRSLLRRERIRAAAKSLMFSSVLDHRLVVYLNKQAAYAGHVSFATNHGESPLGPITLQLECSDPRSVIEWLVQSDRLIQNR